MDTPRSRQRHALEPLYGAYCHSINRRAILGGAIALAGVPMAGAAATKNGGDSVARAMAAAGGRERLMRVRAVAWSGTARVLLGKVPVDLIVETRIEPFTRARSNTYLISESRESMRTMMIERDTAFVVQNGAQTALPAAQARFERQQLGAYAYLLLAPAFVSAAGPQRLRATRDGFPAMALSLAPDGRIASADFGIPAPDAGGALLRQRFSFSGSVSAQGVRFPRTVTIVQNGKPLSRLTIEDFSVELSPA